MAPPDAARAVADWIRALDPDALPYAPGVRRDDAELCPYYRGTDGRIHLLL